MAAHSPTESRPRADSQSAGLIVGRLAEITERSLDRAARLAAALVHASSARVYTRLPGERLRVLGASDPHDQGLPGRIPDSVASRVMRAGRAITLPPSESTAPAGREAPEGPDNGRPHGQEACLGVPVRRRSGTIVGALVVTDRWERRWEEQEVDLLTDLAALIGDIVRPATADRMRDEASLLHESDSAELRVGTRGGVRGGGAPPRKSVEVFAQPGDASVVEMIRESIVGSLHLGALHAGDRLPSIRQTARAFSVTPYMVLQAYAELELEGLVERRERSGVFVASFDSGSASALPETGAWLTEVLTQACQHQVKIPLLPDLIGRWTNASRIRCACVEACYDSRFTLALELSQQFGIQPRLVAAELNPDDLQGIDFVTTTAYHAAQVGPMVAAAGKPMIIATISPLILSSALNHLRVSDLTVICVDRSYGERLRALQGGAYRDRVRVITTEDEAAIAALDRREAVLLTPAARQRLAQPDFRLIAPMYPAYSLDFARRVAESLIRLNLKGSHA